MKKKYPIILLIVIIFMVVFVLIFQHNQLKIDLYKLIKRNEYESVTLDGIYITDSDELLINLYIEDEKESIGDSLEIRNLVKDYLKKHDEYKNMRVEIFFQTYAQNFSITFANYDEDSTGTNFENSYDINYGRFVCNNRLSLSDFKNIQGIEEFEMLQFINLNDYSDVYALDSIENLKYLIFSNHLNDKIVTNYDYLVNKHPHCKIEIHDSEHLEQTDKLEPEPYHVIIEEVNNEKK